MRAPPEVVIVGAGPAGLAAALRLARAGVRVLVLEAATYAGAENWSGGVIHTDGFLRPDVLGPEGWAQAPKERRIIARALFVNDGINSAGFEARAVPGNDYGEAWTVLRPKFDRWMAARAIDAGATLLPRTAVTGLMYDGERVVGVETDRGPIPAEVVFIAEGDASSLLAREDLEHSDAVHYAQGIKAVFELPRAEIERRFGVAGEEGVAQEWILRNGTSRGRKTVLNLTALLYTNRDSLSVGVVLPLDKLAANGTTDHPHLMRRVLETPGIAAYLDGARQIAYGAKVIRAGGVSETPVWALDGLIVGGGGLGLGLEIPYPNFMAPAVTSALTFADAFLDMRARGGTVARADLGDTYSNRLKRSDDYANAELIRGWPRAIHGGPLLFDHVPALLGQLAEIEIGVQHDGAVRRRAFARMLLDFRKDLKQVFGMLRGMGPSISDSAQAVPPLAVRYFMVRGQELPVVYDARGDRLLALMAEAIGLFYGRAMPRFQQRLNLIYRRCYRWPLALPRALGLARTVAIGVGGLLRDLGAYQWGRLTLRELYTRPFHRHEEATRRALDWSAATRAAASPAAWIAPLARFAPDTRHISVPLGLQDAAARLRRVCPAEVYALAGKLGGVESQFENCIKCESCRVSVPEVDWNRTSAHRLAYRVPGDGRSGYDGAVTTELALPPPTPLVLNAEEQLVWRELYDALRARPPMVGREWDALFAQMLAQMPVHAETEALHRRLLRWCAAHKYGYMESAVRALLTRARALPSAPSAWRSVEAHERARRAAAFVAARSRYTHEEQKRLAQEWTPADRRALLELVVTARAHATEWVEHLAGTAPALAWMAAQHYLAEHAAGVPIDHELAAVVWRERDGHSGWVPAPVRRLVALDGSAVRPGTVTGHGHGVDAAQPVRLRLPATTPPFRASPRLAELVLALALGSARALRERALDYTLSRVQFRGEMKDAEGRDGIAKFGGVKLMLARIEQGVALLEGAAHWTDADPEGVLTLVRATMAPWMDGIPWLAGQIFGGMAYSEEDILARRYRDSFVLGHWPTAASLPREQEDIETRIARGLTTDAPRRVALQRLSEARAQERELPRSVAQLPRRFPPKGQRPRAWQPEKFQYKSGSFLLGHVLGAHEVLTPEHYRRDPALRMTRADTLRLLRSGFKSKRPGLTYGRYIDELHGMPPADIDRLRRFNAFATVVPEALGGRGWNKAQYSVLTNLCMGEKDTAVGLLIMASTSIGTMPVLLGLEKDLPKVESELNACLGDDAAWGALSAAFDRLIAMLERPQPKAMRAALEAAGEQVQRMFLFPGSTLKYMARNWLMQFQAMVASAKERDLESLYRKLIGCRRGVDLLRGALQAEREALPARRRAHARFLQFLASGQISAFALTEPGAGSDTGGIQTRATLREVAVEPAADGFYRFVPHGGQEPRILLDADRLLFEGRSMWYRFPDGRLGAFDDSGWDLATQRGERAISVGGARHIYHDISTVVPRPSGPVYRYFELAGNKMWITNGSIADRYSLFAQTEWGETAFMLERRSEGLRIGPNENKLGQRASPTNELAFDRVRIGADQMIGYLGHGQVNALETLSVGRGGLVMGCGTLADRLVHDFPEVWANEPALARRAHAELMRLQTLGARLMGLMDRVDLHHGDFRIEAAFSKYLASEGLHRILMWLEDAMGPQAGAQQHMIEKWRRDARILNIYEGTNEVQRFLVLKDLPGLLKDDRAGPVGDALLESALQQFRAFVVPKLRLLGAAVWQNPEWQATWFPVVDWAAELYCWVALYERTHALEVWDDPADRATVAALRGLMGSLAESVQALAACVARDFAAAEQGPGHQALALARAALGRTAAAESGPVLVGTLSGRVCAVLRSQYELVPAGGGHGLQWNGFNTHDLAVLDRLLEWQDAAPGLQVEAVVLGPGGIDDALRRLAAAGASVRLLSCAGPVTDAQPLAKILRKDYADAHLYALGRGEGPSEIAFAEELAQALTAELIADATAVGALPRGLFVDAANGLRHDFAGARRLCFTWEPKPSGRADRFGAGAWCEALQGTTVATPLVERTRLEAATPLAPAPAGDVPERFENPEALAAWLRARLGAASAREPGATTARAGDAALPETVWLTAAERLGAVQANPGQALALGLGRPYGVLACGATPKPSRYLAQPACRGLWQLPLPLDSDPAALADTLVPLLRTATAVILEPGERALAARLAAALGVPLLANVLGIEGTSAAVQPGAYRARVRLPARAVLLAAGEAVRPTLVPDARALPLTRLTAELRASSSYARATAAAAPRGPALATARLIVDVGQGIGNEARYKALVPPLVQALAAASGQEVEVGATRKVTQELKLLPLTRQIGQTGITVNPELVVSLGISGAPQHMGFLGRRALVIAINRDAAAPIFSWHRQNGAPRVIACVGEIETWVPRLVELLGRGAQ